MVNTQYLEKMIDDTGIKKAYLASELGITRQSLRKKIINENDFTAREIKLLCEILKISSLKEKEAIFFAN